MNANRYKIFDKHGWWLLSMVPLFILLNAFQSVFTSISRDEAYYWMFSRNLDWGYFDHPPMVAYFIYLGSAVYKGTFGIRLLTVIANALTLFVTWNLIPVDIRKKKPAFPIFLMIAFSMPVFNIYGFITTPDVPLLLFSALYLMVFQQFLKQQTVFNALKLGVVAALLMYSKYHGAFVIIFSLIPHYRLLWNRYFYLAGITGIIIYLPHIYWQYQHDFISFRYHLFQRTDGFMGGKHILNYVMNAFVILNPFLLGLFLYQRFVKKMRVSIPVEYFYVFWGFIVFFGFTSLRDHIEPQWIGVAVIPLTVILVSFLAQYGRQRGYLAVSSIVSILLVLALRVTLMLPLDLNTEFHKQKEDYYEKIREKAGKAKMMFINSYADASKFTYYTGQPAFSYNCYDYRRNQFDIWNYEDAFNGQNVFFLTDYAYPWIDSSMMLEGKRFYFKNIPDFPMINKTSGRILSINDEAELGHIHSVSFTINNPYDYPLVFNDSLNPLSFYLVYQTGRTRFITWLGTGEQETLEPGGEWELKGFYYPAHPPGNYEVAVGLQPGSMSPVLFTEKQKVKLIGNNIPLPGNIKIDSTGQGSGTGIQRKSLP